MSCVVPGCRSGYNNEKLPEGVSAHIFPKDTRRRDLWIKAIPRANWIPAKNARVCSLHFEDSDYKTSRSDTNPRRKRGELKVHHLKPDAIPRKFPGLPGYLSQTRPHERSEKATCESRQQRQAEKVEAESSEFLLSDQISSFDCLKSIKLSDFPASWSIIIHESRDSILFEEIMLDEDGRPTFRFSLSVDAKLQLSMFSQGLEVPLKKISHIVKQGKIERISDISNICAFLNNYANNSPTATDVIKSCITKLDLVVQESKLDESNIVKLSFMTEQLRLLLGPHHSHRFSTSFLWAAITWQKTSPALYTQLRDSGLMTLPSVSYLKQLSSSFSLESGLSNAAVAYLDERIKPLSAKERIVALAIDEVFTSQRVEYVGGQFFGNENQAPTKTLLSFFISSLHGSYEDLVCFVPTITLTATSLLQHFEAVLAKLQAIGFDVKLVLTDGHKTNIKFFTELGKGTLELFIQTLDLETSFYTMFDPVHIFKNFYHNFQRTRTFNFPAINSPVETILTASFHHLEEVFQLELHMPVKLGHKLSHRVLHPGPIERQNVQLAVAIFDDSTISALRFYGNNGHPEYFATANFLETISVWWKMVNVKSQFHASRKRDPNREVVKEENLVEKTSFLRGFVDWLSAWEESPFESKNKLSRETFLCSKHTSAALASLCEFLINEKGFNYFLTGKAQSDKIENRFGKSRQMSGGNLYTSVRQFLESDRILKIKNLAALNKTMAEIRDIFNDANQAQTKLTEQLAAEIATKVLNDELIELSPPVPLADANVLFYVAGSFSRSLCYRTTCLSCKERLVPPILENFKFSVINLSNDSNMADSVTTHFDQVNRGGLTVPSELAFLTCIQAWKFYSYINSKPEIKKVLNTPNISSQILFQASFEKFLVSSEETEATFLIDECNSGHKFKEFTISLARKIFNLFSKNFASVLNSEIHSKKRRLSDDSKRDPVHFKISKLQSNSM